MVTFQQGESQVVNVPLRRNGVDASLATGVLQITAILYTRTNYNSAPVEAARFSLNPESGYGTLKINGDNMSVDLEVTSAQSKLFGVGTLSASVVVRKTDTDLETGYSDKRYSADCGRIIPGIGLSEIE